MSEIIKLTDCYEILKNLYDNKKKFTLLNYELKSDTKSVGYLGEYYNLRIEFTIGKSQKLEKLNLFVKTLPTKNTDIKNEIKEVGHMKKESQLYKHLLNDLQKLSKHKWCAKCLLSRNELIVLENVTDLGYITCKDQTKFFTQNQMHSVLHSLAAMHASSIAYEVKNNINIGEKFKDVLFETSFRPNNPWLEVGKEAILELAARHPNYQAPNIQAYIKSELPSYLNKVYDMLNPSTNYRNVFSHRDVWAGNIFFKNEKMKTKTIFVDFQLCRYSPPAIDVLMALYLGLQPNVRQENMSAYCLYYYKKFHKALSAQNIKVEEHIEFKEFMQSIEDLKLFGIFYNCICATVLRLPNDFVTKMKVEQPTELDKFMCVERLKTILKLMQADLVYCQYINRCIEDLLEFVLSKMLEI